jgi:hypothetical protein
MTRRKAVIDVDEILWSFSKAFYDEIKLHGYDVPVPDEWDHWSIFWLWLPKQEAFLIFDVIHGRQSKYAPYKDAKEFLTKLRNMGYYIIIASHRNPDLKDELIKWLDTYELPYDELHVSFDKTVLFDDPCIKLVVDDRPETLVKAKDAGKIAVGLMKPWNRRCGKLMLFKTLQDITEYLKTGEYHDDERHHR